MIFASLTMLCLLCAPTLAQSSSPSASQYEPGACPPGSPGSLCAQSVADGADDFSENAGEGADAVNEAMQEPEAEAMADPEASPSADATAGSVPPEGGPASAEAGGSGGITSLPETGGAPLAAQCSGILLATFGLIACRVATR